MKKMILFLMFLCFFVATKAQVIADDDFSGATLVLDSTITQDHKLQIVYEGLYSESGLLNILVKAASKEKAETGKIEKVNATQTLIDDFNQDYQKFAMKFVQVDTVYVDSLKLETQIDKIQTWQQSVLNVPQIKDTTSLSLWEQKAKRLEKLLYYRKQIIK